MKCRHCGYDNRDIDTLCSQCGKDISPEYPYSFRTCVSCQSRLEAGVHLCPACGADNEFETAPSAMQGYLRMDFPLTPLRSLEVEVYPDEVVVKKQSKITSISTTTRGSRLNWRASNILVSAILVMPAFIFFYLWTETGEIVLVLISALMAAPGVWRLAIFMWLEAGRSRREEPAPPEKR